MERGVVDQRYEVLDFLGGGGMAEVYLARDTLLERDVALKFMKEEEDEEAVERFRQEAKSAAALSHPNIVPIYDRGRTQDGLYYIVMEYVPRQTLAKEIRSRGALPPLTAVEVAIEIAEALQEAHERGVIHRDIKPANVLVTGGGDVKVADFGIALPDSPNGQNEERTFGTVPYMSPEQAKGLPVGPRSDLYSLGVVIHEMLTGEIFSPAEARPEAMEDLKELDALVAKLLADDPEQRHSSAAALIDDLESVRSGLIPAPAEQRDEVPQDPVGGDEERRLTVPGRAAVLSLLVPGLGQVYNGQIIKALTVMVAQLINFALTAILIGWVPLVFVWIWAVRDAHRSAHRILAGERGRWRLLPWAVAALSALVALLAITGWNPLQAI